MKLLGLTFGRNKPEQASPVADPLREAGAFFAAEEYEAAIAMWLPLAQAGEAEAQHGLATCLMQGLGAPADQATGTKWLLASSVR